MTKNKFITGVASNEDEPDLPQTKEIQLISAEWKPGSDGFQFNKKCFLAVKIVTLQKTIRTRITGKLFCIFNDTEEDLQQEVEGFIDESGNIALMEIKKLWFSNAYYQQYLTNNKIQCHYIIKNITHSRGVNTIDSCELLMPDGENIPTKKICAPAVPSESESQQ